MKYRVNPCTEISKSFDTFEEAKEFAQEILRDTELLKEYKIFGYTAPEQLIDEGWNSIEEMYES